MKERSINRYEANWLDRNHLGFINLVVYAFLPHTKAERDELMVGQSLRADEMNALWPRPWLYMRTFILLLVELGMLFVCWHYEQRYEASKLLPGLTVVGSLMVPVTLLVFFWEINKWRTLTLLDVLRYFLLGSCLAITITFVLEYLLQYMLDHVKDWRLIFNKRGNYVTPLGVMSFGAVPLVVTAIVEELSKALATYVILLRHRKQCHILHGVLVGATVGAGFAVFESAGYILMDVDNLLYGIIVRSLSAPACHVAWGALMGGAVAWIAGGRMRLRTIMHPLTLMAGLVVCALHFCWNHLLDSSARVNCNVELMVFTWFLLLLLIWQGLLEIEREQQRLTS